MKTFISDLSQKEFSEHEKILAAVLLPKLIDLIKEEHKTFTSQSVLAVQELKKYQDKIYQLEFSELASRQPELDNQVLKAIRSKKSLIKQIHDRPESDGTFGDKVADKVASFGGSWTFIITFSVFIFIWILFNIYWLSNKGFDPYPFILLNLILSCLAAFQAPVIMMSQNRKEDKDRDRAEKDYMINLKSEFEIRQMQDKLDHLLMHQQQEMLKLQQIQIDKLNDLLQNISK